MLSPKSGLYRFLEFAYKIVLVNFLIILGSIGVFTIGTSISSAFYIIRKIVRGEDRYVIKDFFRFYKENLIKTSIISLVFAVLFFLLNYNVSIISPNMFFRILQYLLIYHLLTTTIFALFLNTKHDIGVRRIFTISFVLVNRNLYILGPFLVIPYYMMFLLQYIPFVFFIVGFSLLVLLLNFVLEVVYKKQNLIK